MVLSSIQVNQYISTEILIAIAVVVFALAFLVVPFFFGGLFVARRVQLVDKDDNEKLLEHVDSLSKVEVQGAKVIFTRASDVKSASFQMTCKGKGLFKMNKKIVVDFADKDSVELQFKKDINSLYIVEIGSGKNSKPIFLSDLVSSIVIGACQFVALALMIALTVYSNSAFNNQIYYRFLNYYPGYNYAYLTIAAALILGVVSFFVNFKKMKRSQKAFSFKRKGGK